jgi:7-carboxy-7-deazaguanine synthase
MEQSGMIPICEIFNSIDGEGLFAGGLATFIRTQGCNLNCRYCDGTYATIPGAGKALSVEEILDHVSKTGYTHVTLTGGEPLIHRDSLRLCKELSSHGHLVNIETNGTLDFSEFQRIEGVTITMDYKTPASGVEKSSCVENLRKLRENDVAKFVMANCDISRVREVLSEAKPKSFVYFSPVFGEIQPSKLVDFVRSLRTYEGAQTRYRVQLQLHKYIWDPSTRGV